MQIRHVAVYPFIYSYSYLSPPIFKQVYVLFPMTLGS